MDKPPRIDFEKESIIIKNNKRKCLHSAYLAPGTAGALHILTHLSSKPYDINTINIIIFLLISRDEDPGAQKG